MTRKNASSVQALPVRETAAAWAGPRPTRRAVVGSLVAAGLGARSASAQQDYPNRPIRLVAPFIAGTITDIIARDVGNGLAAGLKQPVLIDNRAGAGGVVGAAAVAAAAPDGYTLLMGSNGTHAISPWLHEKLNYDPVKSFVPISLVASGYSLLVVHPGVEARNVAELIALAKARPGQLRYGSGGIGTTPHLAGELFKMMAGIQIEHVPYKGSTLSAIDLAEGRIQLIFANVASVQAYIKTGRMRVLAVTSPSRVAEFPDVPTVAESGLPDFAAELWVGLFAPAGTPPAIVDRINQQVRADMANPEIVRKFAAQGIVMKTGTPQAFAAYVRDELVKWGKVVKVSGARLD